jgi:hypothetical protein
VDCSAKAVEKATRTIKFSNGAALGYHGPIPQARHVGRSQTGLQGVGMLKTTILPRKADKSGANLECGRRSRSI